MGEGEVELSDHFLVPNSDSSRNVQILDEMLRNAQTCTHTHTHVFPSQKDGASQDKNDTNLDLEKPRRRPSGNREAVRKYREKRKANTAYLEEEVKKLRAVNEQMVKKVQRQVVLEAEVMRLRGLLLKLRDKIDSELGSGFPFHKHCNSATLFKEGGCAVQSRGN